jgi:predicted nucleic acid-binding protein
MQVPDVDVLIYAHRQDAPEHDRYAAWLTALVEAPEPFAVAEIVLAGFLRIVTNPKIFRPATPMETPWYFAAGSSSGHEPSSLCRVATTGSCL